MVSWQSWGIQSLPIDIHERKLLENLLLKSSLNWISFLLKRTSFLRSNTSIFTSNTQNRLECSIPVSGRSSNETTSPREVMLLHPPSIWSLEERCVKDTEDKLAFEGVSSSRSFSEFALPFSRILCNLTSLMFDLSRFEGNVKEKERHLFAL